MCACAKTLFTLVMVTAAPGSGGIRSGVALGGGAESTIRVSVAVTRTLGSSLKKEVEQTRVIQEVSKMGWEWESGWDRARDSWWHRSCWRKCRPNDDG